MLCEEEKEREEGEKREREREREREKRGVVGGGTAAVKISTIGITPRLVERPSKASQS